MGLELSRKARFDGTWDIFFFFSLKVDNLF